MPTDASAVLVLTSCPNQEVATAISDALVAERLAACVTVLPGARSTYRWKGEVTSDDELVCLIKTSADRIDALLGRLPALHPYEVPEALVLPIERGLVAYLSWVIAETRPA
jgi:periplasmic divalent cation tolerance protein